MERLITLEAIQHVQNIGPALSDFFTDTKDAWAGVNSFIGALNVLRTIGSRIERKKAAEDLLDHLYGPLKRVMDTVSNELESSGLPPEQCDLIAYKVLRVMLEDPSDAAEFTKEIEKAAPKRL
jgi:hypothetical protein